MLASPPRARQLPSIVSGAVRCVVLLRSDADDITAASGPVTAAVYASSPTPVPKTLDHTTCPKLSERLRLCFRSSLPVRVGLGPDSRHASLRPISSGADPESVRARLRPDGAEV
jgi:hypothetical protein